MTEYSKIFDECLQYALVYEGNYSNNTNDLGGETYKGISRKYNKNWKGWEILDKYNIDDKKKDHISNELDELVKELYYNKFWKRKLDIFDDTFIIENEKTRMRFLKILFSHSIILGSSKTFKTLQVSINVIIQQKLINIPKLKVDGIIGPKTYSAIISFTGSELINLTCFYGSMVMGILTNSAISNKKNYVFLDGWINRITQDLNFMIKGKIV